jgi:metallo-beta-lactamase class B
MARFLILLAALRLFAATPPHVFPPFRIIGNVYYVGDDDLCSYLITTPKGNILINTGYVFSVPEIQARMKLLGFKYSDIKILLITHAHSDHAAGMALVKKQTGAKMMAMEQEVPLIESGGKTDYLFGSSGWFDGVKVDRVFKDGGKIELGGTELTAHLTPGHTPGATSYSWDVVENGKTYHVLIANMANINPGTVFLHNPKYPKIMQDYEHTFEVLKQLPCDVFLSSHAAAFAMLRKWHPNLPYSPETFVDPENYYRAIAATEASYERHLDEEREEEQAIKDRLHFKDVLPQ